MTSYQNRFELNCDVAVDVLLNCLRLFVQEPTPITAMELSTKQVKTCCHT